MNSMEYPDESDSSDEDYLPANVPGEVVSEAESEGIDEDPLSDKEDLGERSMKRKKTNLKSRKKLKKKTENKEDFDQSTSEKSAVTEEVKKKQDDDLWAFFKKETNFKARPSNLQPNTKTTETKESNISEQKKVAEKVRITEIFEFAGEEVKVEKEVAVNSLEAKKPSGSTPAKKGPGRGGGLGSFLSQLGKKQKITTLEKSKLDWDKFKKEENLEEEITTFNKGKNGYLERQDFLQRTDLRRFEIEKEVRTIERNKRMNDA